MELLLYFYFGGVAATLLDSLSIFSKLVHKHAEDEEDIRSMFTVYVFLVFFWPIVPFFDRKSS